MEQSVFPLTLAIGPVLKNQTAQCIEEVSHPLSIAFHQSMCLLLFLCHAVFITIALQYILKSGIATLSAFLFHPKLLLLSWVFFLVVYEFWDCFFKIIKFCCWDFNWHCIESVKFQEYGHFDNVGSAYPGARDNFYFLMSPVISSFRVLCSLSLLCLGSLIYINLVISFFFELL